MRIIGRIDYGVCEPTKPAPSGALIRNRNGLFRRWSAEEKAVVRKHWATKSCDQIAGMLIGRTRNAVIGCAHRIGLHKKRASETKV